MTERTIRNCFVAAGLTNVLGILTFSRGFTNTLLAQPQPTLFSTESQVLIVLWGCAYLAISRTSAAVPWLPLVFAVEKLVYVIGWLRFVASGTAPLTALAERDLMTAAFYAIYGILDMAFAAFFLYVFVKRR